MTLTANSQELQKNSDYEVEITNNINAGEATVTITGKGNYSGTKTEHFTINKLVINIPETPTDKNYNKELQQSGVAIPNKTSVVIESSTISATNVENYNVVLSLYDTVNTEWSNHTTTNQTITWKIVGYSLTNAIVNYDGTTVTVKVPIPSGSTTTLVNNTDYTYTVNTVGIRATVEVTGKGNYSGTKTSTFEVGREQVTIPDSPAAKTYIGASQNSGITAPNHASIVTGSSTLSATDAGSYNVVLRLDNTSTYEWEDGTTEDKTITWRINPINLSNATISGIENKTYTGSAITQAPTVQVSVNGVTTTLTNNTDYTYDTTNNTNAGEATITVTGTGNFTGTKTATFKITQASFPCEVIWGTSNGAPRVNLHYCNFTEETTITYGCGSSSDYTCTPLTFTVPASSSYSFYKQINILTKKAGATVNATMTIKSSKYIASHVYKCTAQDSTSYATYCNQ